MGGQRRLDLRCPVQEPRLIDDADGIGLAKLRHRDHIDTLRSCEERDGAFEHLCSIPEVRAQADVGTRHVQRAGSDPWGLTRKQSLPLDDDGRKVDGRIQHDIRLANPHANTLSGREALEDAVGDRPGQALE